MIYCPIWKIILFCLFLLSGNLYSINQYNNTQIIDLNNFSDQPVFNIVFDQKGFAWISSRSKISRYDGRNNKYYSLTDSEIISDNDVRQVFIRKDKNNGLWAFTDSGKIYFYNEYSDSFDLYFTLIPTEGYLSLNDIFWDNKGLLWLATSGGLAYYNPDNRPEDQLIMYCKDKFITVVSPVSDNLLVIGTYNGLFFFNTQKNKISGEACYEYEHITTVSNDKSSDYLWIGTFSSGLFRLDLKQKQDSTPDYIRQIPHVPVKAIAFFDNNNLLIGLDGRGVYKADLDRKITEQIFSDADKDGRVLDANGVYAISVDKKNIWVGTYTGGLTIIKEPGNINWVKHTPYNRQSLMNNYVHAIYEDSSGDMWYATKSGVSWYNIKTGNWKHYFEGENSFLTITEDGLGNIWCGGFSAGIYCINKKNGHIRHIKSLKNLLQADCIYASTTDEDKNIWFGGLYNPLTCISNPNGQTETYSSVEIYQVNSLSSLNKDTLFVSTTNGFYLLNKKTREFRHHFADPYQYGLKSSSFIYSGVLISDNLWFGTDGGGLNCLNLKTNKVENYSTYNGFPSNYIYGINKDKKDNLWISTNKGIFVFDPINKKFLSDINGLPVKHFVFNSFTTLGDGSLAFGSRNGAVIFNPEKIEKKNTIPDLSFTDFRLSYKKVTAKYNPDILPYPIDQVNNISLDYNQNTFSFDFIAIDLYNPDNYIYNYMLEGFDQNWVSKANILTADYVNIPSGNYTFKIRCINNSGGDILAERDIHITIGQPFWNTIWAWIIYLIIAISLLYLIWNYYKDKLMQKQSEEKIDFFINIAHDIRTPLSLVISPLNDLQKEQNLPAVVQSYIQLAKQNCDKLVSIVTQLLDFQKVAGSSLQLNLSLCDFKIYLRERINRFEILIHKKSIHLSLDLPAEDIFVEIDTEKMDRILDNIISNAIKYTLINGKISVRLLRKDKRLILEVEDNGIGISKNEQKKIFRHFYRADNAINSKEVGSGIGLVFTKKLVELMQGELSFSSRENIGTTFKLSLPVRFNNSEYKETHNPFLTDNITQEASPLQPVNKKIHHDTYKILIVEDNDDMRNYLAHALSAGYHIESVSSAEEAFTFLESQTVDLVISDIMMPGMNGDELCSILKNNIETSHIQIILLTALAEKGQMRTGLECGADDYITKPFDMDMLKIKVQNLMKTRKRLQQHYLSIANVPSVSDNNIEENELRIKASKIDNDFLFKCIHIVTSNISNIDFTITDLCRELAMSRTLVYEKLKILTNQSPNEFIRSIRMKQAKELLLTSKYTVQEVSEMTGFSDSKYFSTVFKKYFGENPSKILL